MNKPIKRTKDLTPKEQDLFKKVHRSIKEIIEKELTKDLSNSSQVSIVLSAVASGFSYVLFKLFEPQDFNKVVDEMAIAMKESCEMAEKRKLGLKLNETDKMP